MALEEQRSITWIREDCGDRLIHLESLTYIQAEMVTEDMYQVVARHTAGMGNHVILAQCKTLSEAQALFEGLAIHLNAATLSELIDIPSGAKPGET